MDHSPEAVDAAGKMTEALETLERARGHLYAFHQLIGRADFLFDRMDSVGLYAVRHDGATRQSFAVNLLDPGESDLSPRAEFNVGAERVAAGETGRRPHDLWKYLAAGAFLLLLVE